MHDDHESVAVEEATPVDVGALAERLRPPASVAAAVFWWLIFVLLVFACTFPSPILIAATVIYAIGFAWSRGARRRAFLSNLAQSPCLSRDTTVEPRNDWPSVTAIVPARDEETALNEAARSLSALPYPNLKVVFVNDHSTDRTPEILDVIQRDLPNVQVIHDPPRSEEWFGKSNALWQAFRTIEDDPQWLLFADADVVFEPGILQQAVALAERDQLDFLTCMPRLIAKSWAEQFLLPTGWRGIAQGADPKRLNEPGTFPIGIGAFMLVKTETYRAFGGHKALGRWHPEDTLMAGAVKEVGGHVGFAWSPDLLRVQFYDGYRDVKKSTLRKTRIFFGDRIHLPLTMMAVRLSSTLIALPMAIAGVAPQLIDGQFDLGRSILAVAGVALYVVEVLEYRGVNQIATFHPLIPWLHPISGVLRVWFALSMIGQIIAKKPMEWRGREEFGSPAGP